MGFEPTAPRTTIWCSNLLSYNLRLLECKIIHSYLLLQMKNHKFDKLVYIQQRTHHKACNHPPTPT